MKKLVLSLLAISGLPAFLYAVDGQVLINQATVNNTGGFPYHISQPGSYKLSGNLTVPAGSSANGIVINADNVTLDLNGFTITGGGTSVPGDVIGITSGNTTSKITVKNGSVTNFDTGLYLPGSGLLLTDLHVDGNFRGMNIGGGNGGNIVVHCTANSNLENGMMVFEATVSDSTASDNGQTGIEAGDSILIHNIVLSNGLYGMLGGFLYGSNIIRYNHPDVSGGTSQNNNLCTSGGC